MLHLLATAVMLLTFISSVAMEAIAADATPAATKAPELKLAPNETAIYVSDMHCSTCAKKISGKLFRLKGVVKVRTDVKKHLAVVTSQAKKQVDAKAAWAAVQKAGFEPTKLIGPQGTYVADEKTKEPTKTAESETPTQS